MNGGTQVCVHTIAAANLQCPIVWVLDSGFHVVDAGRDVCWLGIN
jgi:hypothetical protein